MNIYEELGVKQFVNAYRPLTRLGGALMSPTVLLAMQRAAQSSVDIRVLQQKVGEAIARLTNNEAAYVSCGAASGITLAVAGCMARTDPVLAARLPQTDGMRNQVLLQYCDSDAKAEAAIRCSGAHIVNVGGRAGTAESDFTQAINSRTAAILAVPPEKARGLPLNCLIELGRRHRIPVLIDAAFLVPPRENLWKFTRDCGADAVAISGGKGIGGPQSTGLVLGKKWIVDACAFHGAPNDRIGRGMKVGKEELAGIYAAVKCFVQMNRNVTVSEKMRQLQHIIQAVADVEHVFVHLRSRQTAVIAFDAQVFRFAPEEARQWLFDAQPSVYCGLCDEGLVVSTECLPTGDEELVATQLRRLFGSGGLKPCAAIRTRTPGRVPIC